MPTYYSYPPPKPPPPLADGPLTEDNLLGAVAQRIYELALEQSENLARQEAEIKSLRRILRETQVRAAQAQRPEPIPPDLLQLLLQLTHPDRHGNSPAANRATAWLLKQRQRRSA